MSDENKNKVAKNNGEEEKNGKTGYVNWWLFRKKGTVSKPWATAEELWNNPKVQEEIKHHNSSVDKQLKADHES